MKQHESCNGCGAPVNPIINKCGWCGRFHIEEKLPARKPSAISAEPEMPANNKPFGKLTWILIMLVAVVCGVGFFYFLRKSRTNKLAA